MTSPVKVKRIVCLANSYKHSGRCIAGKEVLPDGQFGDWIRPISARDTEEVSKCESQFADGGYPRLIDVIDIPVIEARPTGHQSENWLLDSARRWQFVSRVHPSGLARLTDPPARLWMKGYCTKEGRNDYVPEYIASKSRDSLRLMWTDNLKLFASDTGKSLQGRFLYRGVNYWLRVTDPIAVARYRGIPKGEEYPIGGRYVTVSLGGSFNGWCFKLIAAIIDPREGAAP